MTPNTYARAIEQLEQCQLDLAVTRQRCKNLERRITTLEMHREDMRRQRDASDRDRGAQLNEILRLRGALMSIRDGGHDASAARKASEALE